MSENTAVATPEVEVVEGKEYKLVKPIMIDDKMTSVLKYDLEELTGDDVSFAIKELGKRGMVVTMNETDQNYHAMLFSIAAGISFEDVKRLKIKDFNKVCNIVRDFFLAE